MKRRRGLMLLLCVLLAALAVFFGIRAVRKSARGARRADVQTVLTTVTGENLSRISYIYDKNEITLLYDGGRWTYAGDPDMPLNPDIPNRMYEIVTKLASVRTVARYTDKADYGINSASIRVTAEGKNGASYGFAIGSYVGFSEGCYIMMNGNENLYFVPGALGGAFSYHGADLVELPPIPKIGRVDYLCVERPGERFEVLLDAATGDWYSPANGERVALNAINTRATVGLLSRLEWLRCVDYSVPEAKMAQYGLDRPTVITAGYVGADHALHRFALCVGAAEGSSYYARLPSSQAVLLLQGELVAPLLNAGLDKLRANP